MNAAHRKTISWVRTSDGNHDLSINMSTIRLVSSTIVAVATAVTTTIGLSVMLLKPAASAWVRTEIATATEPIHREQKEAKEWRLEHQAAYIQGRAWMTEEDQRSRAERAEMLHRLDALQARIDEIYRIVGGRR